MAKVSFPILKEQTDGSIILDKTVDVSNLTVEKDGAAYSTTIANNGDGTYQFNITESGNYTVKLNGQTQSELEDVYISAEDNLAQSNLASSAGRGDIELNASDELVLHNGDTVLHEADIVDNLTSTSTTAPLSANQGKTLKDLVDTKEAADTTILKESAINSDLSTGGTAKLVSAEVLKNAINPSFSDPTYISEDKTVNQNLEILDKKIAAQATSSGLVQYRTIFSDTQQAAASAGSTAGSFTEWQETSSGDVLKIQFYFYKQNNDTKIYHYFKSKVSTSGATGSVKLKIDGSVYHTIGLQTNTSYADNTDESDISTLSDGLHLIEITMNGDGTNTMYYKEPVIQVRSN